MTASTTAVARELKSHILLFLDALQPVITRTTGSSFEVSLAKTFISAQSPTAIYQSYVKHMDISLRGRPVWQWIALKNEEILTTNPALLLGDFDNDNIKRVAQTWISSLGAQDKQTVWQWALCLLGIVGYDLSDVEEKKS